MYSCGKVTSRPSAAAKKELKRKLKKLTTRKRPGTYKEICKDIAQVARGWIHYFMNGAIKTYLEEMDQWLRHRIRQLIWKRWKLISTKYKRLRKLGIKHDSALGTASSRKGYWRLSKSQVLHQALTNKKLEEWGLINLSQYYELKCS